MKTKNFLNYLSSFVVIAGFSFLAACGSKNNDNPPVPVVSPYGYAGCPTCTGVGGLAFFTGQSTDYTQTLNVTWSFAGQNTGVGQSYPYNVGAITPGTYYGLVTATGQMILSQPMSNYTYGGICVIPAGAYTLATIQPGQWGSGVVNGLALQAIGPASIVFSFVGQVSSPGWLADGQLSSGTNPVGRMFGDMRVSTVNGQPCQQAIMVQ